MKIGVFDSGIGGLSVAQAIEQAYPEHEVLFRNDSAHVPYGTRNPQQVLTFIEPIFQSLIDDGCAVIVVACNTVTTTLITTLRERFSVPLVGIEPMVKPAAAQTKTGVIAVCATPATLTSSRYADLKNRYAKDIKVIEPDCSQWSLMIEQSEVNDSIITSQIESLLDSGADVIVLGCTHYHWIEADIKELTQGRAIVIQPEKAVVNRLRVVLARLQ